jgi:hypothetical protein
VRRSLGEEESCQGTEEFGCSGRHEGGGFGGWGFAVVGYCCRVKSGERFACNTGSVGRGEGWRTFPLRRRRYAPVTISGCFGMGNSIESYAVGQHYQATIETT